MMDPRDSNPDVDELLRWSGVSKSITDRRHAESEARLSAAIDEMGIRTRAEWARGEREERRENLRMLGFVVGVVLGAILLAFMVAARG